MMIYRTDRLNEKRPYCRIFTLLLLGCYLTACAPSRPPVPPGTVPSPRPLTISDEQYGHRVLNALTEQYELDYSDTRLDNLVDLVDQLTAAAGADKDPWHVYLFKAPDVKNAAATRGNHVFVWSGLLDLAQNDAEISTVLGHEIAHVLAGHTDPDPNEQVKRMLIGLGAAAAGIAVTQTTGSAAAGRSLGQITAQMTQQVGSGLLVNPYSRERELEADHVGLFIMADAKLDPNAAIDFWGRMQNDPDISGGVEFFSTHPLATDRLTSLEQHLPQAMERFERAKQGLPPPRPSQAAATVQSTTTAPRPPSGGDSFNVGNVQAGAVDTMRWRVSANKAVLFAKPSKSSKRIGEFRQGATIQSLRRNGSWLEIRTPDSGFISLDDVEPR